MTIEISNSENRIWLGKLQTFKNEPDLDIKEAPCINEADVFIDPTSGKMIFVYPKDKGRVPEEVNIKNFNKRRYSK